MEALLYFAFWAGLVFLMMRLGCGRHVMGGGHGGSNDSAASSTGGTSDIRWVPPESDVDPVCGKTVYPANAKSSIQDGYVYYFCSSDCRERFEAAPDVYLEAGQQYLPAG